ncbi:hypothetical protein ACFYNO_01855 [Kitasatospora sp. NPDC006697]|uniref:hypothetical protein n=1 Tax=Kitasatospora sp. NPDC006697 TaxID=3364020 RepID=UPI00367D4B71
MHNPECAPDVEGEDDDEDGASVMTLRVYRITAATGAVTELSRRQVWRGESYWRGPIGGEWPPCDCPRCGPILRARARRVGRLR